MAQEKFLTRFERYKKMFFEREDEIESYAYALDNNLETKIDFQVLDLATERTDDSANKNKFKIHGRFNCIFLMDENFDLPPLAKIGLKFHDKQQNQTPLWPGTVLQKKRGVWTTVEIFNQPQNKKILIGYGLDVDYRQNLLTLPKSTTIARPDAPGTERVSVELEAGGTTTQLISADQTTQRVRAKNTCGYDLAFDFSPITDPTTDGGFEWLKNEWLDIETQSDIFVAPYDQTYVGGDVIEVMRSFKV